MMLYSSKKSGGAPLMQVIIGLLLVISMISQVKGLTCISCEMHDGAPARDKASCDSPTTEECEGAKDVCVKGKGNRIIQSGTLAIETRGCGPGAHLDQSKPEVCYESSAAQGFEGTTCVCFTDKCNSGPYGGGGGGGGGGGTGGTKSGSSAVVLQRISPLAVIFSFGGVYLVVGLFQHLIF